MSHSGDTANFKQAQETETRRELVAERMLVQTGEVEHAIHYEKPKLCSFTTEADPVLWWYGFEEDTLGCPEYERYIRVAINVTPMSLNVEHL